MSGIPDFGNLDLGRPAAGATGADWAKAHEAATGRSVAEATWETPEGIAVPPLYTPEQLGDVDFLDTYPGIAPYLRGPYPTMYTTQPWTVRQYAGCDALAVLRTVADHLGVDPRQQRAFGDEGDEDDRQRRAFGGSEEER